MQMNRPVGTNALDTAAGGWVGKPMDRVDGRLKVTGGATYAYEVMVPALGTNFSLQGPAIPGGSTPPYPDSLSQSGDVLTFGIVNGAAGEFPPTPAIVVLYDQSITVCQACR